ncbi:hypothetical protein SODALDRAFT_285625 [Sodiomyces alkalinus F11]|uniref:Myb-like DNA-binding domain-containing protein n=1 Tax=Sodiomyces alkalinus (strain CBS 110278 / VKM F-3762 / F11) TaxID=1314773 RepID=A0A3N2PJU6_SODAK|nr:hypothetical protein SODALDRAFT_285625 [Sodiomyces alkalinus F11]ROT34797.1 hypothetical protein SODALDRAFT_285625 [Sodiomyces alkalinus F11]
MTHRRGPWTQQEDACLMRLVGDPGPLNWVRISNTLGTRTPKQCRERYHQNLKPSLNHEPITPEEGRQIEMLVNAIGKRWAEIARKLNGRSDNAVKNWWNGNQNRRRRHDRRRAHHATYGFKYENSSYSHCSSLQGSLFPPSPISNRLPYPNHRNSSPNHLSILGNAYAGYHCVSNLPSPSSTASPRSDILDVDPTCLSDSGSCYTTSSHEIYMRVSPPVQLPPLRNVATSDSVPRSLPGVGSLLHSSGHPTETVGSRQPPTPSNPFLPLDNQFVSESSQFSGASFHASGNRDARMAVQQLVNQ